MLDKIKGLIPSIQSVIMLAPFAIGVLVGYFFHTPIGWAIDLLKLSLKIL